MTTKHFSVPVSLKRLTDAGDVQAVFSTQTIIDSDGDRVLSSSFTDGQPVAMAAWGHNWNSLPPGRGVIRVEPTRAIFDGEFFVDTTHGLDHYRTVKRMGELQEWSFGFRVLDSERGASGERVIKSVEVFEVSPVLIGSNRQSQTLAIKAGRAGAVGHRAPPEVAAMKRRFYADLAARDRVAEAEAGAVLARIGERVARDRRMRAEARAGLVRTLTNADRILGRR